MPSVSLPGYARHPKPSEIIDNRRGGDHRWIQVNHRVTVSGSENKPGSPCTGSKIGRTAKGPCPVREIQAIPLSRLLQQPFANLVSEYPAEDVYPPAISG